jgi:hypothetical protein
MVKSLIIFSVIILAVAMAWGIKNVANKNQAAISENQFIPPQKSFETPMPSLTIAPTLLLKILSPQNGTMVTAPDLNITGQSVAFAEVFVGEEKITADKAGNFSQKITLDEGENEIIVSANDASGNNAETTLKISYEPSE